MQGSGFLPVSHAVGFLTEGVLLTLYAIACFLSSGLSWPQVVCLTPQTVCLSLMANQTFPLQALKILHQFGQAGQLVPLLLQNILQLGQYAGAVLSILGQGLHQGLHVQSGPFR